MKTVEERAKEIVVKYEKYYGELIGSNTIEDIENAIRVHGEQEREEGRREERERIVAELELISKASFPADIVSSLHDYIHMLDDNETEKKVDEPNDPQSTQ